MELHAGKQACRSKDRQHDSGGIRQPARQRALGPAVGDRQKPPAVVIQASSLHQSSVHPGGTEPRCGLDADPPTMTENLSPALVQMLWTSFGKVKVDLLASRNKAQCVTWLSVNARDRPPLGVRAFCHRSTELPLACFPQFH